MLREAVLLNIFFYDIETYANELQLILENHLSQQQKHCNYVVVSDCARQTAICPTSNDLLFYSSIKPIHVVRKYMYVS